jgi:hypothetical protein
MGRPSLYVLNRAGSGANRTTAGFPMFSGMLLASPGQEDSPQVPVEMMFVRHRQSPGQNGNVDAMGFGKFIRAPICHGNAKKGGDR